MDPAEISQSSDEHSELHHLRSAFTHHGTVIGRHEAWLQKLPDDLRTLVSALQTGQAGVTAAAPPNPPLPTSSASSSLREPHLLAPERYEGHPGRCCGFLLQCSLAFKLQASMFPTERSRVAYVISLLSERALAWTTAIWEKQSDICFNWQSFTQEMKRVFDHPICGRNTAQRLIALRQGSRSVADYTIDIWTLAAENTEALHSAFLNILSEVLKDELASQDNPDTLDELIVLAIRIDNWLGERRRERTEGFRVVSS